MKNLMLFVAEGKAVDLGAVRANLDLQVENSLQLGWRAADIWLATNFPYRCGEVAARLLETPKRPRGVRVTSYYKTAFLRQALAELPAGESAWYHDVDAYQLERFDPPGDHDLAATLYLARGRMLIQGGSMFFRAAAADLVERVWRRLTVDRCQKDEFAWTEVAASTPNRILILDPSWNLGSSDFELRWQQAARPIRVAHFHPDWPEHRTLFLEGKNGLGARPIGERFRLLLERGGGARRLRAGRATPTKNPIKRLIRVVRNRRSPTP